MKNKDNLMKVDRPYIHQLYHVVWAFSNGVVGKCMGINEQEETVILRNPKTKKLWAKPVKWNDLRHTRKREQTIKNSTV